MLRPYKFRNLQDYYSQKDFHFLYLFRVHAYDFVYNQDQI